MMAHVVPIRGAARDVFFRCAAMLTLTPIDQAGGAVGRPDTIAF
jgi:hypothetical protein